MSTNNLQTAIGQLADTFAAGVVTAFRAASLDDIMAYGTPPVRRGPGRPPKSPTGPRKPGRPRKPTGPHAPVHAPSK